MQLLMLIMSECLLILKEKTKKTKFNINIQNILFHWSITFPSYPDLGKKAGIWIWGGEGYSVTSDLDLGKKLEI